MSETFLTISGILLFLNPLKVVDKELTVKLMGEVNLKDTLFEKPSSMLDAFSQSPWVTIKDTFLRISF